MSKKNIKAHLELCKEIAEQETGLEQLCLHLAKAIKMIDDDPEQPVDYGEVRYKTRLEMRKNYER